MMNKVVSLFVLFFSPMIFAQDLDFLYRGRTSHAGTLMMGMQERNNLSDRQIVEAAEQIQRTGTKVLLSFHRVEPRLLRELNRRNIITFSQLLENPREHSWRYSDYDWLPLLVDFLNSNNINDLGISCLWGVDRTGNATAFVLAYTGILSPSDAWASVINNNPNDIQWLDRIFQERGLPLPSESSYLGSLRYNGRSGTRASSAAYRAYITNVLDYLLTQMEIQ